MWPLVLQAEYGGKRIGQDHMCTIVYLLPLKPFTLYGEVSLFVLFKQEKQITVTTFLIVQSQVTFESRAGEKESKMTVISPSFLTY